VAHALALVNVGDNMGIHFAAIGDGALASYLHTKGVRQGLMTREKANEPPHPGPVIGGHRPEGGGGAGLSSEQLADMAQAPV